MKCLITFLYEKKLPCIVYTFAKNYVVEMIPYTTKSDTIDLQASQINHLRFDLDGNTPGVFQFEWEDNLLDRSLQSPTNFHYFANFTLAGDNSGILKPNMTVWRGGWRGDVPLSSKDSLISFFKAENGIYSVCIHSNGFETFKRRVTWKFTTEITTVYRFTVDLNQVTYASLDEIKSHWTDRYSPYIPWRAIAVRDKQSERESNCFMKEEVMQDLQ
jgi:hypothetical protein